MSAWGKSWGAAFGKAWGAITEAIVIPGAWLDRQTNTTRPGKEQSSTRPLDNDSTRTAQIQASDRPEQDTTTRQDRQDGTRINRNGASRPARNSNTSR